MCGACFGQAAGAQAQDPNVRAQCANITGVSIGDPLDHTTWRIDFTGAASPACQAAALAVFGTGGVPTAPQSGNNDIGGKTRISPVINAQRTMVMLSVGQSLETNFSGSPLYTPVSPNVYNWNIYDRQLYFGAAPLLGTEGPAALNLAFNDYLCQVADKIIVATGSKYDRVIIVPIAIGNTTVADWAPGGRYNDRLVRTIKAVIQYLGMPITYVHWGQGQRDNVLNTTTLQYETSFASLKASIQAAAGYNVPIFVTIETEQAFAISTFVQAAQVAVVDNVTVFQASNFDPPTFPDTNKQPDGTHLNGSPGSGNAATQEQAIISAHFN